MADQSRVLGSGIWARNPALTELIGLCPILAVSTTLVTGLAIGGIVLIVMVAATALVSATRHLVPLDARRSFQLIVLAAVVTAADLTLRAWWPALHEALGIYVAVIAASCLLVSRLDEFAARVDLRTALRDALGQATGILWVAAALGALREIVGRGTLFRDLNLLGLSVEHGVRLLPGFTGVPAAVGPPGAFLGLAMLIAFKNHCDGRHAAAMPATLHAH